MLSVPAEQLVRALSRKGDRDLLRGKIAQRQEAVSGKVPNRLVHVPHQALDDLGRTGERELQFVMLGSEMRRHAARIGKLIRLPDAGEADGERLHGTVRVACHQRDNERGIQPTAQERAKRHVAHHLHAHGVVEL